MKDALVPTGGVAWRHRDGTAICSIHPENPKGAETMISLPLDELLPLVARYLAQHPSAKVLLGHEVVSIDQGEKSAWVNVQTPECEKKFEADYVVGCDGANSKIRRELFGSSFPGFTWDKQIVATNVCPGNPHPLGRFADVFLFRFSPSSTGVLPEAQGIQLEYFQLYHRP